MLTDPCYITSDTVGFPDRRAGKEGLDLFDPQHEGDYSYAGACFASARDERGGGPMNYPLGHDGAGVCVSAGYGDGCYAVYVTYNDEADQAEWGRRVATATIIFIDPLSEEDE